MLRLALEFVMKNDRDFVDLICAIRSYRSKLVDVNTTGRARGPKLVVVTRSWLASLLTF